jgi:hypothetical protein
MDSATESPSAPLPAKSPEASSPLEDRARVRHSRADKSAWGKLVGHFRRKRDDSDPHDDTRRAGDGNRDKDAAFEQMLTITYRSGQGGL